VTAKDRREFAAFVRDDSYRRYCLAQLKTARTRMQLMICEIDSIRQALLDRAIEPDRALGDLAQIGALWFLQPGEPPFEETDNTERQNGF